jgi:hypothetical protein
MWRQVGMVQVWEGEFPEPDDLELVPYGLQPALVPVVDQPRAYAIKRAANREA